MMAARIAAIVLSSAALGCASWGVFVVHADADNPRAIACYERVGFVHEGRLRNARWIRGAYIDQLVMGLLREEWMAAPP